MTVDLSSDAIALTGRCGIEEAETLVSYLESHPNLAVDVSAASEIHTALWQALLVFRPKLLGAPGSPNSSELLVPSIKAALVETSKS